MLQFARQPLCRHPLRLRHHSPDAFSGKILCLLNDTPNPDLQKIRLSLIHHLAELGIIIGKYLSIDSCAILAKVKENNLKPNLTARFNKERICKGDPDARLGVIITFPTGEKKVRFFWGYRDHVIIDAASELPLWQITKPV